MIFEIKLLLRSRLRYSRLLVQTAKAAGVPVILVSFGYAATLLAGLEAEATIDHFDQLDVCAATLLAAKTRRSAPS